ncbi:hypothetical protein CNR27_02705 [Luteimonas chenhongjianii]|uniref:Uncharacterized protein n=1 Tax=Luteimonas chenhongjianii TaxID=2006110 RepID=A0A290XBH5_9GAMM|nr:hypothetical protein CNR27_02705 [Luteimonas chenhongjianii]
MQQRAGVFLVSGDGRARADVEVVRQTGGRTAAPSGKRTSAMSAFAAPSTRRRAWSAIASTSGHCARAWAALASQRIGESTASICTRTGRVRASSCNTRASIRSADAPIEWWP